MNSVIKIILTIFAGLAFLASGFFVLAVQADNLVQSAPAETEIYFHSQTTSLNHWPEKHKTTFINWLAGRSSLNQQQWRAIWQIPSQEISLFTINKQVFGILKNNRQALQALKDQNIPYVSSDRVLYFPKVVISNTDLTQTPEYKAQSTHKTNFSEFRLYIKNLAYLNFPSLSLSALAGEPESPLEIIGRAADQDLRLKVYGAVGQKQIKNFSPQIKILPAQFDLYFQGLSLAKAGQKAPYSKSALKFLVLKSFNGPTEYLSQDQSFILYAQTKENDITAIQNAISVILANIYPKEQIKTLPDDTKSIQLIAQPESYPFQKIADRQFSLNLPELKLNLKLEQKGEFLVLSNNAPFLNTTAEATAPIKTSKNTLIIKNNQANSLSFNQITIKNRDVHKINICIH